MKKLLSVLLILALALSAVGYALAEDVYGTTDPEAVRLFDSKWEAEGFHMDIIPQEGEMKVQITAVTDYPNGSCWEYSCAFDAAAGALISVRDAVKFDIVYPEDGGAFDIIGTVYEEPVQASFVLDGIDRLTLSDGKDETLNGKVFQKIGRFDCTQWACGRAVVEMYYEEEGYRVLVRWGAAYNEAALWEYSGFYYADSDTVVTMPFGIKTDIVYNEDGTIASYRELYDDGEAVFSLDGDGYLIWQDLKENAGKGMRFEQVQYLPKIEDSQG